MSWPTAAVLISLIVCSAVVAVFALRGRIASRHRREVELQKRKELLGEVSAAVREQVAELRKRQEQADP